MDTLPRQRMEATGIGYAGLRGAWWRPAAEPVRWPAAARERLAATGGALFTLLDSVQALYPAEPSLAALLDQRVPAELRSFALAGPVLGLRPDFQVVERDGELDFVVTELEICPSSHGFAHVMQEAYGLESDLLRAFLALLDGRELLIVGSTEWSEFVTEQLVFCRALQRAGGRARVLYNQPLSAIAEDFAAGRIWQPPMFGVAERSARWDDDLHGWLERHDLLAAASPHGAEWPLQLDDSLVFRFGYLECFAEYRRVRMARWQRQGTAFVNPTHFALESKCVMAALSLPPVREAVAARDPAALPVLDRCIPETRLLTPESLPALLDERDAWVTKYAGFDAGNQAWGGRSLKLGAALDDDAWKSALESACGLPWPVVAQRAVASRREDVAWLDEHGARQVERDASIRLRCFLLRDGDTAVPCGAHLTWSPSAPVSEGTEAVQAPVAFA